MYFYKPEEFIKYNLERFWETSFNVIILSFYNIWYHKNASFFSQCEVAQAQKWHTCSWQ